MADEMDPATVLEEAADLLLIKGRCKGIGKDPQGRFCVLGAIATAYGKEMDASDVDNVCEVTAWAQRSEAGTLLDRHLEDQGCRRTAWGWNDYVAKDDFEVIDTLRLAAKDLRNAAVPS